MKYHFVRDMDERKKALFKNVNTLNKVIDSLTKSMSIEKLSWCRTTIGIYALDC